MTLFGVPGQGLDLYHIGLTVPDLGAAMVQYTASFGFSWATIHESAVDVIADGERRQAEIAVTAHVVPGPAGGLDRRYARRVRLSRAAGGGPLRPPALAVVTGESFR
jgi:hypothetical protein